MSSRPRRLAPSRQLPLSFHASLSNAASILKSALGKEREKALGPLSKTNPQTRHVSTGLSHSDTVSRCLATPTASPLWKQSTPCHPPLFPLPPPPHLPLSPHLMSVVRASSILVSTVLKDNPMPGYSVTPPAVNVSERLSPRSSIPALSWHTQRWRQGEDPSSRGDRVIQSRRGGRKGWSVCAASSSVTGRSPQSARDQRPHKALGPLLGQNVLRAASSFHFLHGGLADVASLAHHAPLDGLGKAKASHDPRAQVPRSPQCIAQDAEAIPAEETPGTSTASETGVGSSLRLVSGACALPHPDKAEKGGEDAFFISNSSQAVGVADGVGGWADVGVDAGAYARELMTEAMRAIEREGPVKGGPVDPLHVLETAHANTASQGSSTACVILLSDQKLAAANLGDSGFMIIRSGRTIFKSPPQQHDFNFPYQLGSAGGDPPSNAEVYSLPVAPGDVVVLGTDGLFDNVFDGELASMVMHSLMAGRSPQSTAEHIAALARIRAADRVRFSPFARAAMEAGYRYYGGKMDDITVVVSYVSSGGSMK